jgi:TatD DNase family protein
MLDTHAHLDGPEFVEDLDATIERAKKNGVEKIFIPCICRKDLSNLVRICNSHPGFLYPMIGLHPENIFDEDYHVALDRMEELLEESLNPTPSPGTPTFIAVGEVGLDFYWDDSHKSEQIEVFESQIQWAIRYNLPLMIHSRNAHHELVHIMDKYKDKNLTGVFHCFTGTAEEAQDLLKYEGFCLGIGGILTFKKSRLPETVKNAIPLNRIVLETDSPYMAPTPFRGNRNESAYVIEVGKKLADIFGISFEQIDAQTTKNALKIFRKV